MTGAAEFSGVDIDLLADYIGGALEGTPDESVVATLIADDARWRAAYETLGGRMAMVGAELGRLAPEPMPSDLAARLDEAFTAPPRLEVVHDAGPVQKTRKQRRWVTPIAIAAGVVAFVGFGLDYLAGRDNASDTAANSSAAGSAEQSRATPPTLSSGTDYTEATLAVAPSQPLSAASEPGETFSAQKNGDRAATDTTLPELSRLMPPEALQECLDLIQQANAGGPIDVESVDYARFDGSPAVVVRFTAANGVWAWASGPACGTPAGGADTLARVPVR
ncbi:hypothetical protein [Paractinoplanes atraurantiacus]|uniref:Uncharacterized protein n=1 Tax=Paractinoplanes atraurantiacus TaxID=1036182 RepID=A0A285JG46_9ACTN|nr:hypothetical protein [Actinoplanes atraurantiacus]SNY58747.1 hypothetical protein SAMN05421748_119171 [Actinoplanes atraurantiacus]